MATWTARHPPSRPVYDLLYEGSEIYLKAPCTLSPDMTQEEWESLSDPLLTDEEEEDEEEGYVIEIEDKYFAEQAKVFGGLLPLGSQGCTYYSVDRKSVV